LARSGHRPCGRASLGLFIDCLFSRALTGTQENSESEAPGDASIPAVKSLESETDITERKSSTSTKKAEQLSHQWDEMLSTRLGSGWGVCKKLVLREMRLIIFARQGMINGDEKAFAVSGIQWARSATGIATVWGNKGGLAIKIQVGHTTIAFVSAHLAAHDHKLKARNDMCREILKETRGIGVRHLDVASEFDHCFWFGDLNYRVNLNVPAVQKESGREQSDGSGRPVTLSEPTEDHVAAAKLQALYRGRIGRLKALVPYAEHDDHWNAVHDLVEEGAWERLLAADQLRASIAAGAVFSEFKEGNASFPPTFKMNRVPGNDYKNQRIPSYTDRILWRSMPQHRQAVSQISLSSAPGVSTSDHKPVFGVFELRLSCPPAIVPSLSLSSNPNSAPLVRMSNCRILGNFRVQANVGKPSAQPFFFCYTNPPGVLGSRAPMSAGTTRDRSPLSLQSDVKASPPSWSWDDRHVPLLRPAVRGPDLRHVSLILCFFEDRWSPHDPLGTVTVPLLPPASLSGASEYSITVDSPLRYYNVTKRTGRFRATLTVSYGAALALALSRANQEGAGTRARSACGPARCEVM